MTRPRRAAVVSASFVLEHVPDLVRYGSKPRREPAKLDALRGRPAVVRGRGRLSTEPGVHRQPRAGGPVGHGRALGGAHPVDGASRAGPSGDIMEQAAFYDLLAEVDRFDLVRMGADPRAGTAAAVRGRATSSARSRATTSSTSRSARRRPAREPRDQGERRPRAARPAGARRHRPRVRSRTRSAAARRRWATATSAAAATWRRRSPRSAVSSDASGIDVKSFCAAPVHALVVAAALIEAGIEERVVVVAGGSLGKLGMKFEGALAKGFPILEDVLAGHGRRARARRRVERAGRADRRRRPHAGRCRRRRRRRSSGALVGDPLDALGIGIADVGTYATEIHNPEITEPQGGGDVADRNYKMLAGLGVAARRARRETTSRVRARPRHAGVRADPGPHRERDAVAPARARAHARGRAAPNDADRQGLAVPRAAHAPVGRRVRDPRSVKGDRT